jgi:ribosome-associated protein
MQAAGSSREPVHREGDDAIASLTRAEPTPKELAAQIVDALDADKADDIKLIDLEGKSTIADYMIVATGTSQRHLAAMGEKLVHKLKTEYGMEPLREGQGDTGWNLIDTGPVIVHLFRAETRSFYDLEKLWSVAPPERRAAVSG